MAPLAQSAVPERSSDVLATTQALVPASPWRRFGTGTGGPSWHPALVQIPVPPISAAVVGRSVRVVPSQRTLKTPMPEVGKAQGSGKPTPAPPKYRPPQASGKKAGLPSASRWPQTASAFRGVSESLVGDPPKQRHVADGPVSGLASAFAARRTQAATRAPVQAPCLTSG